MLTSGETGQTGRESASKSMILLYVVFALSGALSVTASALTAFGGFTWGLPSNTHIQSYHPDEQNVTYSLRNMHPAQRDFNPRFWGNPTFYTYQVGALALAASKAGLLPANLDAEYWLAHPDAVRAFYVIGRELSMAYAILSAILVYYVARRVASDRFAPFAAAIMFVSLPVTAVHSHYMTVNASSVFWALAAMLFALRMQDKPSWPNYILAGAFAGFAISTKLNNAFLPLAILAAHIVAAAPNGWRKVLLSGRLLAAIAACAAAFFAGSPYYVLAHREVITDPHNQMNVAALWDLSAAPAELLKDFWNHWTAACGWVLAAVFVAALPLAFVFGPRRRLAPILAVVFPFFALALKSGWWAFPSRVWPLLALLAIITAVLIFEHRYAFIGGLVAPSAIAGLLVTVPWNVAYLNLSRGEHIRDESSRWIASNVHPDSGIIILDTPYYEAPNIVYQNAVHPEYVAGPRYDIVDLGGNFGALKDAAGKWLVVTQSYEKTLREKTGMGIQEYADRNGFELVTTFDRDFEAFGVVLRSWIPADMVQDYTIYIYRRKEAAPSATVPPAEPEGGFLPEEYGTTHRHIESDI